MFTGIVELIGEVAELTQNDSSSGGGTTMTISGAGGILGDCHDGDSISVNGTCLTVTSFNKDTFKIGIAPETLRRTNLGSLQKGSRVNLERAVSASTRMGGHFVQGHVDTVARIVSVKEDGEALTFRFAPREREHLRYVVEKGFVTVDGASLTVTAVSDGAGEEGWFEVMLIAYTQEKIVTAAKREGQYVNVEVDMVGKYVEKNVRAWFDDQTSNKEGSSPAIERLVGRLVDERLKTLGVGR